jgi:hypothetical protein
MAALVLQGSSGEDDGCLHIDEGGSCDNEGQNSQSDEIWEQMEQALAEASEEEKPRLCACCMASKLHAEHRHARCLSRNLLIVPLDNLLLFLDNPGSVPTGGMHPDRRSMYRLMCGLAMSHTTVTAQLAHTFKNPYLMFCSPVTERILHMFKRRYAPRGVATGSTALEGREHAASCQESSSTPHFPTLGSAESIAMVDDIALCWWESVGMPSVLQDRGAACLVRRALRG